MVDCVVVALRRYLTFCDYRTGALPLLVVRLPRCCSSLPLRCSLRSAYVGLRGAGIYVLLRCNVWCYVPGTAWCVYAVIAFALPALFTVIVLFRLRYANCVTLPFAELPRCTLRRCGTLLRVDCNVRVVASPFG